MSSKKSKTTNKRSPTGRPKRFTPAEVIVALEASAGLICATARKLRCSHSTVIDYIDKHPEIATRLDEIVEETLDIAEASLLQLMRDSKSPTVQLNANIFYLRTKGKKRGYTMATEVMGKDGGPIETNNKQMLDLSNLSTEELAVLEQAAMVGLAKANVHRTR